MGAMFEFSWLPLTFPQNKLNAFLFGCYMQYEKIKTAKLTDRGE